MVEKRATVIKKIIIKDRWMGEYRPTVVKITRRKRHSDDAITNTTTPFTPLLLLLRSSVSADGFFDCLNTEVASLDGRRKQTWSGTNPSWIPVFA